MKEGIGFIFGCVVGAGAAWYFSKKYYEQLADEEISDIRAFYNEKLEKCKDVKNVEEGHVEPENYIKQKSSIDYDKIIDRLNYGKYDETEQTTDIAETVAPSDDEGEPYLISSEEYGLHPEFNKVMLTYFNDDDIFMTNDEQVVDEGMELVGESNMDCADLREDGMIFVRNPRYGTDYHVVYEEGSYADYIE